MGSKLWLVIVSLGVVDAGGREKLKSRIETVEKEGNDKMEGRKQLQFCLK